MESPAYLKIKIMYLNGLHKLFRFDKENKRHNIHRTLGPTVKVAMGHVLLGLSWNNIELSLAVSAG